MSIYSAELFCIILAFVIYAYVLVKSMPDDNCEDKIEGFALTRKYRVLFRLERIIIFVTIIICSYLWYISLANLLPKIYKSRFEALCIFIPSDAYWGFAALLLGMGTSFIPIILLYKSILKEKFYYVYRFTSIFPIKKIRLKTLVGIYFCYFIAIILIFIGINCYLYFQQDRVIIKNWLDFNERTYSYKNVNNLYYLKDKKYYYKIVFDDNYKINTREMKAIIGRFEKVVLSRILHDSGTSIKNKE